MNYFDMTNEERSQEYALVNKQYQAILKEKLSIDLSVAQLPDEVVALAKPVLDMVGADVKYPKGSDYSAVNCIEGIEPLRALFAALLEVSKEDVFLAADANNLVYDVLMRAYVYGVCGGTPWCKLPKVRFICPTPGNPRHFAILQAMGIEMIAVPMGVDGPDMNIVEELVRNDDSIKGLICMPRFGIPAGVPYSDAVIDRLAHMQVAASDFRIYWDNTYFAPIFSEDAPKLKNVFKPDCNPDRFYLFVSLAGITMASNNVSALVCSPLNMKDAKKYASLQTLTYDKHNQYAQYLFLKDAEHWAEYTRQIASLLRPRFERFDDELNMAFPDGQQVSWGTPASAYMAIRTPVHMAKYIVELCAKAGLTLSPSGTCFPGGHDDLDSTLVFSPIACPQDMVEDAVRTLIVSIRLAILERMQG